VELAVECVALGGQMHVSVDAAELLAGFEHPGRTQRIVLAPPPTLGSRDCGGLPLVLQPYR
jgi:hypothetical protein